MPKDIGMGTAVELPDGIFNVTGQWRYNAVALEWWLWELDNGEGRQSSLARVGDSFYTPRVEPVDSMPQEDTLDLEDRHFALVGHGEARAEHASAAGHDFWLAEFRQYAAQGQVLIFTADKGSIHRLVGAELDGKLVQVYAG